MPQLDFLAFSTQVFWLVLCLSILLLVIFKIVIPDILLITRTRETLLEEYKTLSQSMSKESVSLNLDADQLLKLLNSFQANNNTASEKPTNISTQFNGALNSQEQHAFFLALTRIVRKGVFMPFLALVTLTDDFILFVSFLTFFSIIYTYASKNYINPAIQQEISKVESQFSTLVGLRHQVAAVNLSLFEKLVQLEQLESPFVTAALNRTNNFQSVPQYNPALKVKADKSVKSNTSSDNKLAIAFKHYNFLNSPVEFWNRLLWADDRKNCSQLYRLFHFLKYAQLPRFITPPSYSFQLYKQLIAHYGFILRSRSENMKGVYYNFKVPTEILEKEDFSDLITK